MIIYIAPQQNWVWTNRISTFFYNNNISCKIFEPEKGLFNLFLNFFKFLFYYIFHKNHSVLISFASTNGYLASYIPFLRYTLIIHGTYVLSKDKKVLKRSGRAIRKANKIYIASASKYVSELLILDCNQKFEWGLSQNDFEYFPVTFERSPSDFINVAGIRHIRPHYKPVETINTFIELEKKLGHVKKSHFCGLPFKNDLEKYLLLCKQNNLEIDIIENLERPTFLRRLSSIDIGISLAESDLFGGPILEMLYFGNYVIVSDSHPILHYKQTYQLDGLISIKNLNNLSFNFSVNSRKLRAKQFEKFTSFLNFDKSMEELTNEYL